MKSFLAIILSISLLFGITPTIALANNGAGDFATIRDVSGIGGAVDVTCFDGKYYAITPTSILVSSDTQSWSVCYENMRYQFSKIETLNNELVIISYGQSNNPDYGTTWYTDIITSSDGENFTAHQTGWNKYESIVYYGGKYYLSYNGSDGYFVDSTTDFETYTATRIAQGDYYAFPMLKATENALYACISSIYSTMLFEFDGSEWKQKNTESSIVVGQLEVINGTLYGVMIKKTYPREIWLYRYEASGWVGVCKIKDGENMGYPFFLDNRVIVTARDYENDKDIIYLSSDLSGENISFSVKESDLFSYLTYHAKSANNHYFAFDGCRILPKISTDLTTCKSMGTAFFSDIQIAVNGNTTLATADGKLYDLDTETGNMTELHHSESIIYNQIFSVNGQFYIFAMDSDTYSNKVYMTADGTTLTEKSFTFSDTDGELPDVIYMSVLQFVSIGNSYKLLISKGDGLVQLFESTNGMDFTEDSSRHNDMLLEGILSYAFGDESTVALAYDGNNTTLFYSSDGVNYQASAIENGSFITGIIYQNDKFIAYGSNDSDGTAIYTSEDGATFTRQNINIDTGEIVQLIPADGGYYAILHDYMMSKSLYYSPDLQSFSLVKNNLFYGYSDYHGEAAEQLGGYYRFAKGDDMLLAYSLDGMIYKKSITPPQEYSVSYNLDGGSGTIPPTAKHTAGTGFTVTSTIPTLANHTFAGWDDGKKTYQKGAAHPGSDSVNIILTAVWQENGKYTVTYSLNGGDGTAPAPQSYYVDTGFTVTSVVPTKAHHTFKGWSDGTSLYQPNAEYTISTKSVTFTAQWEKISTYTASFTGGDGAIGDAPESKTLAKGKLFVLPENPFSKTNCTFKGWSDGKKTYQPKQSYSMPEGGITFTAVWEEKPEYKVYVHNAEELIAALNNAPYGSEVATVILANDITNFNHINLPLSAKNIIGQKQNVVLDLQGYTLAGAESGQYFTNAGTVKITGTKDGKLNNCTIYAKQYSKLTIENITVAYRVGETDHIDLLLSEGEIQLNNCKIDLDYIGGKCGDGSSLTAVRNLPSGTVYVNDGTDVAVHTAYHSKADAVEGHKDGTWYGIENLGTVYLRGGAIHCFGPAIFNGSGIYHEQQVHPQTILTSGHLSGGLAVSKAYYDNKGDLHYTVGDYIVSDGSYIELHNFNPTTGMFDFDCFTEVDICKITDSNVTAPNFTKNLSGEYVYAQNEKATPLSVSVNVGSLSYTWYKNTENTIIGATMVGTEKTYTPSTADKGTNHYFVVIQSAQYINGQIFKPTIISSSTKVTVVSALSDKPIELKHYTGITLDAEAGILPSNTVMQITPVTEGGNFTLVSGAMNGIADKFTAFDITLLSNGVEIQPNGKVKIRIPIPKDFGTENLIIYRVNEDGSKAPYTVKVVDGFAEFETDHFSLYVLSVKAKADTSKTESPQTGDNAPLLSCIVLASLSGMTIVGLSIKKKRFRIKKY